jgi:hypothetical protein
MSGVPAPPVRPKGLVYPAAGWLRWYINKRFGCPTQAAPRIFALGAAPNPDILMADNYDRLAWIVCNVSAASIWLGYKPFAPALNSGHYVAANGGIAVALADDLADLVGYEVKVFGAAPPQNIYVAEVIGVGR